MPLSRLVRHLSENFNIATTKVQSIFGILVWACFFFIHPQKPGAYEFENSISVITLGKVSISPHFVEKISRHPIISLQYILVYVLIKRSLVRFMLYWFKLNRSTTTNANKNLNI